MILTKANPGEKLSEFPHNDGAAGQVLIADGLGGGTFGEAASPSWSEITGAATQSSSTFTVPVSEANYMALRPGLPLKIMDAIGVYKFSVIVSHAATGLITIAGAPLETLIGVISELYVGPPEKTLQLDVHIPGSWDITSTALIEDQADKFLQWHTGRSFLVNVDIKTKVQDTGILAEVNVTIGGSDVISSDLRARDYWDGTTVNIVEDVYGIDFNDVIEVTKTSDGGNQDSTDLTVSLTFVLESENIDYEPASPDPYVQMTIGIIPGTWAGLGEGIHTLIPTSYTKTSTGTHLTEQWKHTVGSQKLRLQADLYGSSGSSRWVLEYTASNYSVYSTRVTGRVQNRLFQTGYVQNGVSFTWSRGGELWGW